MLLEVAGELDASPGRKMALGQIKAAADRWVYRRHWRTGKRRCGNARSDFIGIAVRWFRFLGRFNEIPKAPIPFSELLRDFIVWMEDERGLSKLTIEYRGIAIRRFLRWYGVLGRPFSEVRLTDIDTFLVKMAEGGWSRRTMATEAGMLRPFFRYAGSRGWCPAEIAGGIRGPRIYTEEGLPIGPLWEDVKRLLASLETDRPYNIRNRAMLLLCAVYGLRSGEVIGLRLEDIDWEHDRLLVRRPKVDRAQAYPLVPWVGNAILRYLREVRPKSACREVFLTLSAPVRPMTRPALFGVVARRMSALGIQSLRCGPHALRHACATHLASQGLSFKVIGDHLGHSSPNSTRVYAKVDLPKLREVAALDLGGVL
jgi:site-specific recombinase XerD